MRIQSDTARRAPEDQATGELPKEGNRERMLDKTIADSFPASDPPSSLPNPSEDSFATAGTAQSLGKAA